VYRLEGNGFSPPLGYRTPEWPSLYWPFNAAPNVPQYLYYSTDIWRFTLFWTFTIFGAVFLAAGLWAWSVYFFKSKWAILIPIVYVASGLFIALISGTIVGMYFLKQLSLTGIGFTLAALYNAGFTMSTWIPFFWGLIQMLTVLAAGYSTVSSIL